MDQLRHAVKGGGMLSREGGTGACCQSGVGGECWEAAWGNGEGCRLLGGSMTGAGGDPGKQRDLGGRHRPGGRAAECWAARANGWRRGTRYRSEVHGHRAVRVAA